MKPIKCRQCNTVFEIDMRRDTTLCQVCNHAQRRRLIPDSKELPKPEPMEDNDDLPGSMDT